MKRPVVHLVWVVLVLAALFGLASLFPVAPWRSGARRERQLLRAIQAADKVVSYVGDFPPRPGNIRTVVFTDPTEIASLKQALAHPTRVPDTFGPMPYGEKCFEGWEKTPHDQWPRVVFETADGRQVRVWLSHCGDQVWAEDLPWGWGYGPALRRAWDPAIGSVAPTPHDE
jgi:hypothetical protein